MFKIGKIFYFTYGKGCFWFRFFGGFGLHGKNSKLYPPLFRERYGYSKYYKIGKWKFHFLFKDKI